MRLLRKYGRISAVILAVSAVLIFIIYTMGFFDAPILRSPDYIRESADYAVLAPTDSTLQITDWKYHDGIVTYRVAMPSQFVIVTLQKIPLQYRDDEASYERFIGSLKPFVVFEENIGRIALINLVEESSFAPNGQSAILRSGTTLLIAHPESGKMTQDEWSALFTSFRSES